MIIRGRALALFNRHMDTALPFRLQTLLSNSAVGEAPALTPRPIGIALSAARLPRIYPQPHDIPRDLILTEDGIAAETPDPRTDR